MKNKIKTLRLFLLLNCILLINFSVKAQFIIGGSTPENSAILELRSTNKGFLIPRLSTAERDAIQVNSSSEGMMIYNTDTNCIEYYIGTTWFNMCRSMSVISKVNCDANLNATGILKEGIMPLSVTKQVFVDVISPGAYFISATKNGVSFIGKGVFENKGTNQPVILSAIGTPLVKGIFTYTTEVVEVSNCTFNFTTVE